MLAFAAQRYWYSSFNLYQSMGVDIEGGIYVVNQTLQIYGERIIQVEFRYLENSTCNSTISDKIRYSFHSAVQCVFVGNGMYFRLGWRSHY